MLYNFIWYDSVVSKHSSFSLFVLASLISMAGKWWRLLVFWLQLGSANFIMSQVLSWATIKRNWEAKGRNWKTLSDPNICKLRTQLIMVLQTRQLILGIMPLKNGWVTRNSFLFLFATYTVLPHDYNTICCSQDYDSILVQSKAMRGRTAGNPQATPSGFR